MKLFRFLEYDISEGLVRFWKRYLWIVVLSVLVCIVFDRQSAYFMEFNQEVWTPLGYGINAFFGRLPYHFDPDNPEIFTVPFSWILQYLLLGYCVGNYAAEDMRGFGTQLMIRSKTRRLWWCSKCICCVLINVFFFVLLYGTLFAYAWIVNGTCALSGQESALSLYYGQAVADMPLDELLLIVGLLPVLAGIVQSLAQMILSVYINSAAVMTLLAVGLVISAYYGSRFLVHAYAMVCRYYPNDTYPDDVVLSAQFGIFYLLSWIAALAVGGYFLIRKRNII